jgi:hypothetical protein
MKRSMSSEIRCVSDECTACKPIVTRAYRELRSTGATDRDAFLSAVRVLELRHPGHDRSIYFLKVANWLGMDANTGVTG